MAPNELDELTWEKRYRLQNLRLLIALRMVDPTLAAFGLAGEDKDGFEAALQFIHERHAHDVLIRNPPRPDEDDWVPKPGYWPRWLSVKTCAQYIDRTESAVRALVSRGAIPFLNSGRRVYFDKLQIDDWMNNDWLRRKRKRARRRGVALAKKANRRA